MGDRKFWITMHCAPDWRLPDDRAYDPVVFSTARKLSTTFLIASALPTAVAAAIREIDNDSTVEPSDVTVNFGIIHAVSVTHFNAPDILITLDDLGGRRYGYRTAQHRRQRIVQAVHEAIDGAVGHRVLHEYPNIRI